MHNSVFWRPYLHNSVFLLNSSFLVCINLSLPAHSPCFFQSTCFTPFLLFVSADHSFMCVPSSLLACACLCDAISHMAPERLSACVETLAQLAGLEKVRTCLYHFMAAVCMCVCVVVEWGLVPKDNVQAYSASRLQPWI